MDHVLSLPSTPACDKSTSPSIAREASIQEAAAAAVAEAANGAPSPGRVEIKPAPSMNGGGAAAQRLTDEIRTCRQAVVILITPGCSWDEGVAAALRLVRRHDKRYLLVHCIHTGPFPAADEWPADVRCLIHGAPRVKYLPQYGEQAVRAMQGALSAAAAAEANQHAAAAAGAAGGSSSRFESASDMRVELVAGQSVVAERGTRDGDMLAAAVAVAAAATAAGDVRPPVAVAAGSLLYAGCSGGRTSGSGSSGPVRCVLRFRSEAWRLLAAALATQLSSLGVSVLVQPHGPCVSSGRPSSSGDSQADTPCRTPAAAAAAAAAAVCAAPRLHAQQGLPEQCSDCDGAAAAASASGGNAHSPGLCRRDSSSAQSGACSLGGASSAATNSLASASAASDSASGRPSSADLGALPDQPLLPPLPPPQQQQQHPQPAGAHEPQHCQAPQPESKHQRQQQQQLQSPQPGQQQHPYARHASPRQSQDQETPPPLIVQGMSPGMAASVGCMQEALALAGGVRRRVVLLVDGECCQRLPERPAGITNEAWKEVHALWEERLAYVPDYHATFMELLRKRLEAAA